MMIHSKVDCHTDGFDFGVSYAHMCHLHPGRHLGLKPARCPYVKMNDADTCFHDSFIN
jgi:hypothetical protein